MFKKSFLIVSMFICFIGNSQIPAVDWIYTFGGKSGDVIYASELNSNDETINVGAFRDTIDFDQGSGIAIRHAYPGKTQAFVQKLDAQGNFIWVKTFGGNDQSYAKRVSIGADGSIFISGYFNADSLDFDPDPPSSHFLKKGNYSRAAFLLKLDMNGNFLWAFTQGGDDLIHNGIKIDKQGNLYTIGVFETPFDSDPDPTNTATIFPFNFPSSLTYRDMFIQKINRSGQQVWLKAIKSINDVSAQDLELDINEEPVVAGYFKNQVDFDPGGSQHLENSGANENGFVLRIDSLGNFKSVKRYGGTGAIVFEDIELDKNYNVYLTGHYDGSADFDPGAGVVNPRVPFVTGYFIEKLSPSQSLDWVQTFETPVTPFYHERRIMTVIDDNLNVYTSGSFSGASFKVAPQIPRSLTFVNPHSNPDIFIVKQDSLGTVQWGQHISSNGIGVEQVLDIQINSSQNLQISGYFQDSLSFDVHQSNTKSFTNGYSDAFTVKFANCPPPLDTTIVIEACEYHDINPGNRIYSDTLLVDTLAGSGVCDSAIVKTHIRFQHQPAFVSYSKGVLSWDSTNTARYQLTWISCDSGDTVSNGATFTPIQNGSYALIVDRNGCADTSSCVSVQDVGLSEQLHLDNSFSIYPNPVSDVLYVEGAAKNSSLEFRLSVLDFTGKRLISNHVGSSVSVIELPAGAYFVIVQLGEEKEVHRFLKR